MRRRVDRESPFKTDIRCPPSCRDAAGWQHRLRPYEIYSTPRSCSVANAGNLGRLAPFGSFGEGAKEWRGHHLLHSFDASLQSLQLALCLLEACSPKGALRLEVRAVGLEVRAVRLEDRDAIERPIQEDPALIEDRAFPPTRFQ